MTDPDLRTDLLVIGAGPYAYSAAAYAQERGIDTHVLGRPMAFWRDQMPEGMFLRSGPDWSLDAAGQDSFEAYFEHAGLSPADVDPIPIGVFLDHTDWFAERKHLAPDQRMVTELTKNGTFVATLEDGSTITADKVLAAPGIAHYAQLPAWYEDVPADRRWHTSELVDFDDAAGKRVAIIGGRQSAYEWAALLCDHGAARVDVVHRHETPKFEKVSWKFVDPLVEQTLAERGWWRNLPTTRQQEIALQFWQVGRLTLEWWLTPRLRPEVVTSHPGTEVATVAAGEDGRDGVTLTLTDGQELDRRPGRVRVRLPRRPRQRAVPLRRHRPGLGHRRVPRPQPRLRDVPGGPLHHGVLLDPRLRAVLRLHQGVPVVGEAGRGRDGRRKVKTLHLTVICV